MHIIDNSLYYICISYFLLIFNVLLTSTVYYFFNSVTILGSEETGNEKGTEYCQYLLVWTILLTVCGQY